MKFNSKIKWWVIVSSAIVAVVLIVLIASAFYFYPVVAVSLRTIKPVFGFQYKNTLTCTIIYSTNKSAMQGINLLPSINFTTFTLQGLDTETPQILVDGKSLGNWQKVYNGDTYLTIQSTPTSWNMDTIGLMKDTGTFIRTISGLQAGDVKFHYAIAQKGRCE